MFLSNSTNAFRNFGLNASEDINGNGVLDVGEDINGNGVLDMILAVQPETTDGANANEFSFQLEKNGEGMPTSGKPVDGEAKSKSGKGSGKGEASQPQNDRGAQRKQAVSRLNTLNDDLATEQQQKQMDQLSQLQPQTEQIADDFGVFEARAGGRALGSGQMGGGGGFGGNMGGAGQRPAVKQPMTPMFSMTVLDADGLFQLADSPQAPAAWTQIGGLSLPIEIPQTSNKLSFSKVSGAPKLALKLRSREVFETGFGLLWTIVWLGTGLTLAGLVLRARSAAEFWQPLSWLLVAVGLVVFFILPDPLRELGFMVFVLGLLLLAARFVRARATTSA